MFFVTRHRLFSSAFSSSSIPAHLQSPAYSLLAAVLSLTENLAQIHSMILGMSPHTFISMKTLTHVDIYDQYLAGWLPVVAHDCESDHTALLEMYTGDLFYLD